MKAASVTLLALVTVHLTTAAQEQLEIIGIIDGTDRIVIRQEAATWEHLSFNLEITEARMNGVPWKPSLNSTLENSGPTLFLTNKVNFLAARLEIVEGRDTVVLQRDRDHVTVSFADSLNGPGTYHVIITFPPAPTLLVEGDIDGSDELHVSYSGARWIHKHWSSPANVRLNGIPWDTVATPFLLNDGATTFLAEPVSFENAVVLEQSARDLLTVRPVADGLILNFADGDLGAGHFSALISFPEDEPLPDNLIPVVSTAAIQVTTNAAISVQTVRGTWYELQSTDNLSANNWFSTGGFVRGNGGRMTLFDPIGGLATRFYRVIVRTNI